MTSAYDKPWARPAACSDVPDNLSPEEHARLYKEQQEYLYIHKPQEHLYLRTVIIFGPDKRKEFDDFLESGIVPKEKLEVDRSKLTVLADIDNTAPDSDLLQWKISKYPGIQQKGIEHIPSKWYDGSEILIEVQVKHKPEEHCNWYRIDFDKDNRLAFLEMQRRRIIATSLNSLLKIVDGENPYIIVKLEDDTKERESQLDSLCRFPGIKSLATHVPKLQKGFFRE
eukprot:256323_1